MAYVRKTHDEWSVEGYHSGSWDTESYAKDRKDAQRLLREYKANCPRTAFRIVKHRVPNKPKEA